MERCSLCFGLLLFNSRRSVPLSCLISLTHTIIRLYSINRELSFTVRAAAFTSRKLSLFSLDRWPSSQGVADPTLTLMSFRPSSATLCRARFSRRNTQKLRGTLEPDRGERRKHHVRRGWELLLLLFYFKKKRSLSQPRPYFFVPSFSHHRHHNHHHQQQQHSGESSPSPRRGQAAGERGPVAEQEQQQQEQQQAARLLLLHTPEAPPRNPPLPPPLPLSSSRTGTLPECSTIPLARRSRVKSPCPLSRALGWVRRQTSPLGPPEGISSPGTTLYWGSSTPSPAPGRSEAGPASEGTPPLPPCRCFFTSMEFGSGRCWRARRRRTR